MEEKELIRSFIALDLPREVINQIEDIQKLIKNKKLFYGKTTEPENLHLTLKFLGEIDEEKLEEVKEKLKEVKFSGFEACIDEIGVFSKDFLKIIWVKLDGKEVFDLQKQIDEKMNELGFEIENRFMSHITIARIKKPVNKKALLDYIKNMKISKTKMKVDKFILKKSVLKPEGPVYENIGEYSLESQL